MLGRQNQPNSCLALLWTAHFVLSHAGLGVRRPSRSNHIQPSGMIFKTSGDAAWDDSGQSRVRWPTITWLVVEMDRARCRGRCGRRLPRTSWPRDAHKQALVWRFNTHDLDQGRSFVSNAWTRFRCRTTRRKNDAHAHRYVHNGCGSVSPTLGRFQTRTFTVRFDPWPNTENPRQNTCSSIAANAAKLPAMAVKLHGTPSPAEREVIGADGRKAEAFDSRTSVLSHK